jgi:hypothetical protein
MSRKSKIQSDELKYIKAEQRNSQRLEKASNELYRDYVQPIDTTTKLTTQEILRDIIKLRTIFRKDLQAVMESESEINEVIAEPEFNVLERLQTIVQMWPKMIGELQSKGKVRFITGTFMINFLKNNLDKWDNENQARLNEEEEDDDDYENDYSLGNRRLYPASPNDPYAGVNEFWANRDLNSSNKISPDLSNRQNDNELPENFSDPFADTDFDPYDGNSSSARDPDPVQPNAGGSSTHIINIEKPAGGKPSGGKPSGGKPSYEKYAGRNGAMSNEEFEFRLSKLKTKQDHIDALFLMHPEEDDRNLFSGQSLKDLKKHSIKELKDFLRNVYTHNYDYVPSRSDQVVGGFGLNSIKMRKVKVYGRGIEGAEQENVYVEFGKFIIHRKQLDDDSVLNVKYKSMGPAHLMPRQLISRDLSTFISTIIDTQKVNQKVYEQLPKRDRDLFDLLVLRSKANLHYNKIIDGGSINNSATNILEDTKRFALLKGELIAGNDSKEIIKEFKSLVLKFIQINRIDRDQGLELLELL